MINVDQITARLARMPDAALQQYAAMHKNDPYIMALAVSESNRRKQLRQAAQGAQGEMEQPKVADQALAEMAPQELPEEQGIARLPVGDMNFAEGGIVAFADGGLSSALSAYLRATGQAAAYTHGTPAQRAAIEAAFRSTVQGPFAPSAPSAAPGPSVATPAGRALGLGASRLAGASVASIPVGIATGLTSAMESMREQGYPVDMTAPEFATGATPEQMAFDEARRQKLAQQRAEDARTSALVEGRAAPTAPAAAPAGPISPAAMAQARTPRTGVESTTSTYTRSGPPAPADRPAAGGPGTKPAAGPGAPGAAGAPGTAGAPVGLGDLNAMFTKALETAGKAEHPYKKELTELGQAREKVAKEKVEGLEAIQKQFSDIFKGRKERLDTREAEIAKMKDQNIGLALLQAGANIMGTPGSIATAVSKGIKVGSEQYASGLERLRGAQERLLDARDRLEEVETQRNEMSARELFNARNEAKNVGIAVKEDMIKAYMQMYNVNRETAMKLFEQQVKVNVSMYEQQQQTQRTGMSNAATIEAAKIAAAARTTGREDTMEEYTKWLKENPQYMANPQAGIQAFLQAKAAFSGLGKTSVSDKPSGNVRE